ncbi:MAG: Tab2 family RNA-binding protein [Nostoc sp.]
MGSQPGGWEPVRARAVSFLSAIPPLPENLWGEQWRFATLAASDVETRFSDRPIPILHIPEHLKPINLGLASTIPVSPQSPVILSFKAVKLVSSGLPPAFCLLPYLNDKYLRPPT